jgi:hypothetical protein
MKRSFSATCDRYGYLITGIGESPQIMALFVLPSVEDITLVSDSGRSEEGEHRQVILPAPGTGIFRI